MSITKVGKKYTAEDVERYYKERGCELLDPYIGAKKPMKYRCVCGNIARNRFSDFKIKKVITCEKCTDKHRGSTHNKHSFEYVKHYFEDVRGFRLLESEYINSTTPMRYICSCGREAKMIFKDVKKGRNCKYCGFEKLSKAKQIYTIEYIKQYFQDNGCTLLEDTYDGKPNKPMNYICECGTKSRICWSNFLVGNRCKTCRSIKIGNAKRKYSMSDVRVLFQERGKELLEQGEFKNSLTLLKYICSCGTESSITLNNFLKGKDCYVCRNKKIGDLKRNDDLTDEERYKKRYIPQLREWRTSVYVKDDYTCQSCGYRGKKLNAHHIFNYADHPDRITDISNGITLCQVCHYEFHATYGFRKTNDKQLDEFLSNKKNFKGAN